MEHQLSTWLVQYGALALFFAQAFGILGVPIPDELLLTISGALLAKGLLSGPSTVTATILGCLTGISLSYCLGRFVGLPILRARFRRHHRAFDRAHTWFGRFGVWLLAFGYFIPGVRHVTAIMAGSADVTYPRFAAYAYAGGVLWCSVFLLLGYYAGDRWRGVAEAARSHLMIGAIVAVCAAVLYALVHARSRTVRRPS
jgi:membrane protein DedA with SNARE-associated domain